MTLYKKMILKHLIIFAAIFVILGAASTWVIFLRMVRENLKMREIEERKS